VYGESGVGPEKEEDGCFVLGSKSDDGVEVVALVLPLLLSAVRWSHVQGPLVCFMFEEEGVVAGFCSGFCRACGLAWNDMAAGRKS
jgi:hypothetical protein